MKNKIYIIHENDEGVEPLRKELKDINGRYVTTTILHNEEISDIYDTLKEQVSKNIKIENTLQEFVKLSPEDQSKVLTKAAQLKEAN